MGQGTKTDVSRFRVPPMPHRRDGSTAMLAAKRSAGVTPDVNPGECISRMPPPSVNKAAHSGFETQRRCHQKSKTGVSVAPQKSTCCDIGQIDRFSRIELFPLSSCQVIILIARMTFNCSTSCLMS